MEHDELEDSSHNTYVDHDPLDYVYSNLPDHTHLEARRELRSLQGQEVCVQGPGILLSQWADPTEATGAHPGANEALV